jgi:hypothetical protein
MVFAALPLPQSFKASFTASYIDERLRRRSIAMSSICGTDIFLALLYNETALK